MKRYLLRVDLTRNEARKEEIPPEILATYIGGKGLAAYYCFKEIAPGTDPLSPAAKLMFFVGPLTGLFNVFSRHIVAGRSPLSGTFCDSSAGGWFGVEMAKAGWMGIILEGRAERPSLLRVEGDTATLEDAGRLVGRSCTEVDAAYKDYRVATIGPAGEKLVKYAIVSNDSSRRARAGVAGRGGMGAVMGSKNLKAILVKATGSAEDFVPAGSRAALATLRREYVEYLKGEVHPGMGLGGNLPAIGVCTEAKIMPVSNFRRGFDERIQRIDEAAFKDITIGKRTCYLCPLACGVTTRAKTGPHAGTELDRIEYEAVALNGSNCLQFDAGTVLKLNQLCNEVGVDTMSFGVVTSFVMELSEKGLIDHKLEWGDGAGQIRLLEMIAAREGIGDLLAEGVAVAGRKLGQERSAVHVKGLEVPGYDPRGPIGMALAYATSDRGADHLRAWTVVAEASAPQTIAGKAKLVKFLQDRNAALWTLCGCDNIPANTTGDPMRQVEFSLRALETLGIVKSLEQFLESGERIYNLTRQFNVREGFSRQEDRLPERLMERREDTGWSIGAEDFGRLLDEYYVLRGWDRDGRPTANTRRRLGLSG